MLSLAAAATALLVPSLDPTSHSRLMTRRGVLAACGLATTATPKQASAKSDFKWGPLAQMTEAQMDALDEASREPSAGVLLPSGVRVIDMVVGDGPEPATGKRVYCHYKVWAGGFRAGKVADWSFYDDRPYDWVLGQPTERLPTGVDEGVRGMREGGEAHFEPGSWNRATR
jgi:FKBP-type peptidyl-prolyl cis-trans isomerase